MSEVASTADISSASAVSGAARPTFEALYAQYGSRVFRMLAALGVREAELPDACQEVFVVVHRRLPEFDGLGSTAAWLHAIALRVAASLRRRAHVRHEQLVEQLPEPVQPATQHHDVEHRRQLAVLRQVLDGLEPAQQEVFVLFELEQLTMAEIAAAQDCPLQTAYSRLYAARRHVEAAFKRLRAQEAQR